MKREDGERMGNIQIMDEFLSNKIAAGEVVERPASVVKELVENAVDAGASSIEVFLEEAGLVLIQVIDNGHGMDEEDALKAFARHATSKIHKEQDLFRIRTLGFRGEALASIASVSKVTIQTSDGETNGVKLYMEGGHLKSHEGGHLRKGTDITVAQLFYNTPARLKYLKTIQTELGHTIDLMNRLAIGYPNVAFKLVHNGQTLLQTNGRGDVQQVLAAIYGVPNARKMFYFEGESNDYKIYGYATYPEITRASKNYMSILVNGRWVKHFLIQKAISNAYHTFLPIERYPIVVIYIEGDPQLTDVNVHPAKHQIRLSKEPELLSLIEETIKSKLREVMHVPAAIKKEKAPKVPSEQINIWNAAASFTEERLSQVVEELKAEQAEQPREVAQSQTGQRSEPFYERLPVVEPQVQAPIVREEAVFVEPEQEVTVEEVVDFNVPSQNEEPEKLIESEPSPPIQKREPFPPLEVVGQIHGTYIVAQMEDGFYLIDQHAAQERVKYEFYREKVGEVDAEERQMLLLPLTFHYAQDEALTLKEYQGELEQVGIYLEEFGTGTFIVREHPTWFPQGFEQEIIEEMLEQVLNWRKVDVKKLREEAAIMMSCKRSIKANYYLTKEQMDRLLEDLRACEQPFTCPHGRPILIHFSTYEIEKMFKRVM